MGYRVKHTEYRVGYRVNTQNTEWVIGKTHRIQSGLLGKHTEYRVGYWVNTQNTEWVIG